MPQSLAKLHVHLVFSTKHREPLLHDNIRESLHKYLSVVFRAVHCTPITINSVEDHVHCLFELGRTVTISDVTQEVKQRSSKWLKVQGEEFSGFRWQAGYGAFAVSASEVAKICDYISGQRDHHADLTYSDEYRNLLQLHGIEFDERYVWD